MTATRTREDWRTERRAALDVVNRYGTHPAARSAREDLMTLTDEGLANGWLTTPNDKEF